MSRKMMFTVLMVIALLGAFVLMVHTRPFGSHGPGSCACSPVPVNTFGQLPDSELDGDALVRLSEPPFADKGLCTGRPLANPEPLTL